MELVANYILYFISYAFLGWLMEVICKLVQQKKFVNRGFLLGPICPIYGYGVLGIVLLIGNNKSDILDVFLKSILICSVLEYFTSYFMEKKFKARWWDYSNKKFNINGRICLETMIPFGILGTLIVYVIHPFVVNVVNLLPATLKIVLAIILLVIYIVDNIISCNVLNKIKGKIEQHAGDNTEIIHEKITSWLEKNSAIYRHIMSAYPKFKINFKHKN